MRKVYGIGETVFDIVFKDGQPIAGVPGGSTFNSIVSVGRCGVPATILTEFGQDKIGEIINGFLARNGVCTDFVNHLPCKTPVSVAFLNDSNEAQYSFYREKVEARPHFEMPDVQKDDIVIFGSFYAVNPASRPQVSAFLEHSKKAGAIVYYDVNFRPSHKNDLNEVGGSILENFEYADVLRGSRDDFLTLYNIGDADAAYQEKVSSLCPHFIFTDGSRPVRVRDIVGFAKEYPVHPIETVSTIGAGDSFNAGFAYGLVKYGVTGEMIRSGLSENLWDRLINCAQSFSADCCKSLYNYISPEFALNHKLHSSFEEDSSH